MNYYLKKLIELGLVIKKDDKYMLTAAGKDYCNSTDDAMKQVEKQPKTGVILFVTRLGANGVEYLVNRRLRQPYFGKVGRMTGKVRFGETLEQAARRELFEETSLVPGSCELVKVYHKLRFDENETCVQDVIFYMFAISEPTGELVEKQEFQENFWITKQDFINKKYDFYDDFNLEDARIGNSVVWFEESSGLQQGY